jgi:hypothetical protein
MIEKLLSPLVFPLGFLAATWVWLRIQSPDHKVGRAKIRFWIACASVIACGKYALAWHSEIGSAWQTHPGLTLFGTLIVFATLNAVAPHLHSFPTMFPDIGVRQHSEARVP